MRSDHLATEARSVPQRVSVPDALATEPEGSGVPETAS